MYIPLRVDKYFDIGNGYIGVLSENYPIKKDILGNFM